MKHLEVPTRTINDLKRSPQAVFEQAQAADTGIYILNHTTPASVVLSVTGYENLVKKKEDLQDQLFDLEALARKSHGGPTCTDEPVCGHALANAQPKINPQDGWE
ncbi:type II toxin-antitoxin system Phd/YefM family antitoxin [Levilactobacillus spicheri]|uniref:Antitoxin n=1 Tax=Levilactobacillus spicheri TaxID=216463 RepID=A0ABQ0WQ53_9LACO|nr:type II toxin-antitoxin system Phd/YefM family antitoxin [Levilactobacillus spicheri]GEO67166.1 hypothetical protein LSP04_15850 [Levilactobacillus spicheri]